MDIIVPSMAGAAATDEPGSARTGSGLGSSGDRARASVVALRWVPGAAATAQRSPTGRHPVTPATGIGRACDLCDAATVAISSAWPRPCTGTVKRPRQDCTDPGRAMPALSCRL